MASCRVCIHGFPWTVWRSRVACGCSSAETSLAWPCSYSLFSQLTSSDFIEWTPPVLLAVTDTQQCQAALPQYGISNFDEFLRFCLEGCTDPRCFLHFKLFSNYSHLGSYLRSSLHYESHGIKGLPPPPKFLLSRLNHPAWTAWTAVPSLSEERTQSDTAPPKQVSVAASNFSRAPLAQAQ